jgi:hypothetical protein
MRAAANTQGDTALVPQHCGPDRSWGRDVRPLIVLAIIVCVGCDPFVGDTRLCVNQPVMSDFTLTPDTVDLSWDPHVSFAVTAERVVRVGVTVQLPDETLDGCFADSAVAREWRCGLTLTQEDPRGVWRVTSVFLDDTGLGQFCDGTTVETATLRAAGFPTTFAVVD